MDHHIPEPTPVPDNKDMAAAAVATMPPPSSTATPANRRYRPAPAKTFQCRGYGDCRMVFSRSEHLARHIRKHTGERPFTCHCGKQFSRLDNLRQHAQTVHADKQDQNERMMQDLTSLHASMTAASKGGQSRAKRGAAAAAAAVAATSVNASSALDGSMPTMTIKQEDSLSSTIHPRPGTSTGYEDGNGLMYHSQWDRASNVRDSTRHSFRDSLQSFRAPAAVPKQHPGQSFLVPSSTPFSFSLPDISDASPATTRPGSSSARPPSATDPTRSLPPISSIVPASLPPALAFPPAAAAPPPPPYPPLRLQAEQPGKAPPLTSSHILPLPTPSYGRRPSTATRPGTAPASFYYSPTHAFPPRSGPLPPLAPREHRPDLSLSFLSGHGRYPPAAVPDPVFRHDSALDEPTSPISYESPFSFHAPATAAAATATSIPDHSVLPPNPRKRPYSGSDDDDNPRHAGRSDVRPISSSGGRRPGTSTTLYDYGSESRPQSRRLSVMELCNNSPSPDLSDSDERDPDAPPARAFVPFSTAATSRPTTSSGLVTSASQLALVDRPTPPPPAAAAAAATAGSPASSHSYLSRSSSPERPSLLARAPYPAAGTNASPARADTPPRGAPTSAAAAAGARTSEFGRGISSSISWGFSSSQQQPQSHFPQPSYSTSTPAYNHHYRGSHVYYGTPPSSPPVGRYPSQSSSSAFGRSAANASAGLHPASPAISDVGSPSSTASAGSPGSGGGSSLSGRRSAAGSPGGDDQVRFATVVGMRA